MKYRPGYGILLVGFCLAMAGCHMNYTHLLVEAERVDKIHAICMVCGEPASRTQRLVNGKPARYQDPVVIIGASELYEARCRVHHEVPRE